MDKQNQSTSAMVDNSTSGEIEIGTDKNIQALFYEAPRAVMIFSISYLPTSSVTVATGSYRILNISLNFIGMFNATFESAIQTNEEPRKKETCKKHSFKYSFFNFKCN